MSFKITYSKAFEKHYKKLSPVEKKTNKAENKTFY